ncbi:hypothetical protein [Polymorphobacter megasporae]|uniref:hypothetical protein n=1 Tax=Glacieibacterium megasporae TaxID=2835787 RepID=UPI001C1E567F|nr:hypothetical protein [Polymorphobacter megasporae]UAJ08693.1 hypothetical protein KTC28_09805 [Polymorphobacter megasporae]
MIDPERSSPFLMPRDAVFRSDLADRAGSAATFITIYLGVIVGFGTVMAALIRAAGG